MYEWIYTRARLNYATAIFNTTHNVCMEFVPYKKEIIVPQIYIRNGVYCNKFYMTIICV